MGLLLKFLDYIVVVAIVPAVAVCTGILYVFKPSGRRVSSLLWVYGGWTLVTVGCAVNLLFLRAIVATRLDMALFRTELWIGLPGFHLCRALQNTWEGTIVEFVYHQWQLPVVMLAFAYARSRRPHELNALALTYSLNLFLAGFVYAIFPAAGPLAILPNFPSQDLNVYIASRTAIQAIPNCIPSVHTSTALLILHFSRHWDGAKLFGIFWTALTVIATLSTGQHYTLDLIVAVPYAALVIHLGGYSKKRVANETWINPKQQYGDSECI